MINNKALGNKIKNIRCSHKITQSELANKLNVSFQAISNWERGVSQIDIENLVKISQLFNVSIDYLLKNKSEKEYYLAIDGGGTKTEFVVLDDKGHIFLNFIFPQSNPNDVGLDKCVSTIVEGINKCLSSYPNIQYIFAGIAGLATGNNKQVLSCKIKSEFPLINMSFDTDIENLFNIVDEIKTALIMGTGSVLFVKENGERHQFGGWGYLLDNYGSGYDIGNAAIRVVLDEKEKGNYVSEISKLILSSGVEINVLIKDVYSKGKAYIASFAHFVFEAYKLGDDTANKIICENVRYLESLINKAENRFDLGNKILLAGGIIEHYQEILIPLFNLPKYELVVSSLPQIIGACKKVLLMNDKNNKSTIDNLIEQYHKKSLKMRKQRDINITSFVKSINGIPRLFINNEITIGDSYITYTTDKNDYKKFSDIGFNIFSIPIYFATRVINETTHMPPFCKGIYESKEGFAIIDDEVNKVLKVNPRAYIFFRLDVSLPVAWDKENIDELNDEGVGGYPSKPCISSDKYIAQIKKYLKETIEYIQQQSYADRIFGYQIAGLNTQEWLAFDNNGNEGKRTREKYYIFLKEKLFDDTKQEYYKFRNEIVAQRIIELAHYVKQLTDNRLVVGSFYGYVLGVIYHRYGHLALQTLLECKDIDFLCSPIAYYTQRSYLNDNPLMVPVASLSLHNKLYFTENDTRTDLTVKFSDVEAYNTSLWRGPNREFSLEICKMHYASSICRAHTYWWFDMFGHWYDDKDYLSLFTKFLSLSKEALSLPGKSVSEVAIIVDIDSLYDDFDDAHINKTNRDIFPVIGCSGVSFDVYLSCDFKNIKNKYKCFIILQPKENENILSLKAELKKDNIPFLCIDGAVSYTSEQIREILKSMGINVLFNHNIILYENESYLYIHGIDDVILQEKSNVKLVNLLDNEKFPLHVKKGHGYLFKKIKA